MKKAFAGLLALFGLSSASPVQQAVEMVDPNTLLFSIPTISDDAAPVTAQAGSIEKDDLVFHEDDWRQIEFFPVSRLGEIQQTLSTLAVFEKEHRAGIGWNKIYVRKLDTKAVLPGPEALGTLVATLGISARAAPVLYYGQDAVTGRVTNGFSLPLGKSVALYGFTNSTGIPVLGASVQPGSDDQALSRAFAKLNVDHRLIMVDWRAHLLLVSVAEDGDFEIWRP